MKFFKLSDEFRKGVRRKTIWTGSLLTAVGLVAGSIWGYNQFWNCAEGIHAGIVTKLEEKGFIGCNTYEGEMLLNNYSTMGSQGEQNVFKFSVIDSDVAKKIMDTLATSDGHPIPMSLHAREVKTKIPCVQRSNFVVTEIKSIGTPIDTTVIAPNGPKMIRR